MFWRVSGMTTASPVDSILDKEDYSLRELLEEDELIQECKGLNPRLIDFLKQHDVVRELLSYLTDDPPEDADASRKFKFPFAACELFCCEVDALFCSLLESDELLDLLWSPLLRQGPLDSTRAGYFSRVVGATLARHPGPLAAYLAPRDGLVRALARHVGTTSVAEVAVRLAGADDARGAAPPGGLDWLTSSSLLDELLDRIAGPCGEEVTPEGAQGAAQGRGGSGAGAPSEAEVAEGEAAAQGVSPRHGDGEPGAPEARAEGAGGDGGEGAGSKGEGAGSAAAAGPRPPAPPTGAAAAAAAANAAAVLAAVAQSPESPLSATLASPACLRRLLDAALRGPAAAAAHALDVCVALLEPGGALAREEGGEGGDVAGAGAGPTIAQRHLFPLPREEPAETRPGPDPTRREDALGTLAEAVPGLVEVLGREPGPLLPPSDPAAQDVSRTSYGASPKRRAGPSRLKALELLAALARAGDAGAERAVVASGAVPAAQALLLAFPFHSVLHRHAAHLLGAVERGSAELAHHALEDCALLDWIIDAPEEVEVPQGSQPLPVPRGEEIGVELGQTPGAEEGTDAHAGDEIPKVPEGAEGAPAAVAAADAPPAAAPSPAAEGGAVAGLSDDEGEATESSSLLDKDGASGSESPEKKGSSWFRSRADAPKVKGRGVAGGSPKRAFEPRRLPPPTRTVRLRAGHVGHVTALANALQRAAAGDTPAGREIARALEAHPRWRAWRQQVLEARNARESPSAWQCGRPATHEAPEAYGGSYGSLDGSAFSGSFVYSRYGVYDADHDDDDEDGEGEGKADDDGEEEDDEDAEGAAARRAWGAPAPGGAGGGQASAPYATYHDSGSSDDEDEDGSGRGLAARGGGGPGAAFTTASGEHAHKVGDGAGPDVLVSRREPGGLLFSSSRRADGGGADSDEDDAPAGGAGADEAAAAMHLVEMRGLHLDDGGAVAPTPAAARDDPLLPGLLPGVTGGRPVGESYEPTPELTEALSAASSSDAAAAESDDTHPAPEFDAFLYWRTNPQVVLSEPIPELGDSGPAASRPTGSQGAPAVGDDPPAAGQTGGEGALAADP